MLEHALTPWLGRGMSPPVLKRLREFPYAGKHPQDRVIVCILEQNYTTTQMLPTSASEQAALSTYAELMDAMTGLCGWLNRAGYRAQGDDQEGESIFIHYGVAAGLGQLGLNGQLLTPQAGSRCRLGVIYTDAPLEFDAPVDYGLEGICDRCQVWVLCWPGQLVPVHHTSVRLVRAVSGAATAGIGRDSAVHGG